MSNVGEAKNNKDPQKSPYRPDIDGLRAVAVVLVICFHAAPALVPGGFIGVDVFFVVSGYLIAGLIWAELDAGHFSMLVFYARRCRRIIPALVVVLFATWLIGWHGLFADEFENLGKHVLGGAAFASNLMLAQEVGYFDAAAEAKPPPHLWSLGIEEQFYLVWPALALLAFRRRYRMGLVLAALGLTSLGLYLFIGSASPALTFYLLPARFWEILAGAGLAYYERSRPSGRLANLKAAIALFILAIAALGLDFGLVQPFFCAVAGALAALLLISAGAGAGINRTVLAARPAVFLGLTVIRCTSGIGRC
jgi:peptidoglycan/LPS O-acetylase OafA/YrhL